MKKHVIGVRRNSKLYKLETVVLIIVFILLLIGVVSSHANKNWFENVYVREDGFIENFTIVPLLIAVVIGLRYLFKLARSRSGLFTLTMLLVVAFSFFVAGEEISWGQRVFHVESPEFFKENNAQQETNLHNLVVNGKKINKVVFSLLLIALVAFYLLILPFLYKKSPKVRYFIDYAGVPIPHKFQILAALILFALIGLIPTAKNSEILELGISSIFLLILIYPENIYVFRKHEEVNGRIFS